MKGGGLGRSGGRSNESQDGRGADFCLVRTGVVWARCGRGGVGSLSNDG